MRESVKKTLRRVGIVLILAFALPYLAQAQTNRCSPEYDITPRTVVYYVNGIFEDRQRGRKSGGLIREAYKSLLEEKYRNIQDPSLSEQFDFLLLYSPVRSLFLEALIVGAASGLEELSSITGLTGYSLFWALLRGASEIEGLSSADVEELRLSFTDSLLALTALAGGNSAPSVESQILTTLAGNFREGRRVLLITHDQGILPVRSAIIRRTPRSNRVPASLAEDYFRNIGVLSMAPVVNSDSRLDAANWRYITANDDEVIRRIRSFWPLRIVIENLDNNPGRDDTRGLLNHDFQDAYFAPGLSSRALIDRYIDAYFPGPGATNGIHRPFNPIPYGSGPISVALEWNNESDLDLHVYEPDGTHVFWNDKNPAGAAGFLDMDDSDGFGPERYSVACDTIKLGTYRIEVEYVSSASRPGLPRGEVTIVTDDGRARIYSRSFLWAKNSSPPPPSNIKTLLPIVTFTVARIGNGRYSYVVTRAPCRQSPCG